jgi:DNA-directed RNA polymerase sigma subunit (sigma70/sigma32)
MSPSKSILASEKKLNALAIEKIRRRIRYHKKAEERRIQEDAIIRQNFLEQYPDWETKKYILFPRYRKVIELSYGLDEENGNKTLSLSQIAAILAQDGGVSSISHQRVQQIKNKALRLLARE